MLKGTLVNLSIIEREDLPTVKQWSNDIDFNGEFEPFEQQSLSDLQKQHDNLKDGQWYFIEKKDGVKIGFIVHWKSHSHIGIGYMLVPEERGRGFGSEAVRIMVDYLFLHKEIVRIQAETHPSNMASQRILEKAGFSKEAIIRKVFFSRGVSRDTALYSILREEWGKPQILLRGK
jgi:RimJ/RimL family protein N-acetyltransferase